MKPQFTIRDLLWFVPIVLLFLNAIATDGELRRLRSQLTDVDRRAWGAIGNDRGFDIRIDQVDDKRMLSLARIISLEDGERETSAEIQQLRNIASDHETRIGCITKQFTTDRDLRYEVLVDLGSHSSSDEEREYNESLIRKMFPDKPP